MQNVDLFFRLYPPNYQDARVCQYLYTAFAHPHWHSSRRSALYVNGHGVPVDLVKARKLWTVAALTNAHARQNLDKLVP